MNLRFPHSPGADAGTGEGGARLVAGAGLIGSSAAFSDFLRSAGKRGVERQGPLLLVGEPGTGKSHAARSIHHAGPGRRGAFLHLPLASLAPDRMELELFGSGEDAASGSETPHLMELARGGTVFLHGLAHLPPGLQLRLARALESESSGPHGLACRVMTTVTPGEDHGGEEMLLPSLRKVLEPGRLVIPPLRLREGDVQLLARHFLRILPVRGDGPGAHLSPDALEVLRSHLWPGNVRELRRTVERAARRSGEREIGPSELRVQGGRRLVPLSSGPDDKLTIVIPREGLSMARIESEAVRATLRITGGNRSRAARILAISRPTLIRKIRRYGLVT